MFPFTSLRQSTYPLLPLHQSPQPSSPPAAANTLSASVSAPLRAPDNGTDSAADALQALARQTAHLQRTLQAHLDAQSAGLLAGLGQGQPDTTANDFSSISPSSSRYGRSQRAHRLHDSTSPRSRASSAYTPTSPPVRGRHASSSPYASKSSPASPYRQQQRYSDSPDRTPTATTPTRVTFAPTPRPPPSPPPPLAETRHAIQTALLSLARVKSVEAATYTDTLRSHRAFLSNATRLAQKKAGLEEQIHAISSSASSAGVDALAQEEATLEAEIRDLEHRLAEKRARLRAVKEKKDHDGSRLDARLSSWKAALEGVEKAIEEEVLEGRGLDGRVWSMLSLAGKGATDTRLSDRQAAHAQSVWALPLGRRTLDLVRDCVENEAALLDAKRVEAETEEEACILGAEAWAEAVRAVAGVERALEREVRRLAEGGGSSRRPSTAREQRVEEKGREAQPRSKGAEPQPRRLEVAAAEPTRATVFRRGDASTESGSMASSYMTATTAPPTLPNPTLNDPAPLTPNPDPAPAAAALSTTPSSTPAETGMQKVLARMDRVLDFLDKSTRAAQSAGWKPLICALGAEAEALREGRRILGEAVSWSRAEAGAGAGNGEAATASAKATATATATQPHGTELLQLDSQNKGNDAEDKIGEGEGEQEDADADADALRTPRAAVQPQPQPPLVRRSLVAKEESSDGPSLDLLVSPFVAEDDEED